MYERILEINSCYQCPFMGYIDTTYTRNFNTFQAPHKSGCARVCGHSLKYVDLGKELLDTKEIIGTDIPEWCPLPKKVQSTQDKIKE